MVDRKYLLSSKQMASFVADGYLRFDRLVPDAINQAAMAELEAGLRGAPYGTPLSEVYQADSAIGRLLAMPEVQGMIQSLVGPDPLFDHHAIHVRQANEAAAQHLHGDAVIDTRRHFDIQLMYYPHAIPLEMGGTLLVPGTHFRRINEAEIGRYQNMRGQIPMVCEAGTLLVLHHGIWHCGRQNTTGRMPICSSSGSTRPCASCGCGIPTISTIPRSSGSWRRCIPGSRTPRDAWKL